MSEPEPTPSKFSPRALATAIAVLVPLVPILIALGLAGGGGFREICVAPADEERARELRGT